jgi:hypothetical protein
MSQPSHLYDTARHEALVAQTWGREAALTAIARICAAAEAEFDERAGTWLMHPLDDPPQPGARSFNLYFGATGVVWALRHLQSRGAVRLQRDYSPWIEHYPDRVHDEARDEQHGQASYLFGESAALLLAWLTTKRSDFEDRLHAAVLGNLHNPAHEPLWGNAGTLLAAVRMAEATGADRWTTLVHQAVEALAQDMVIDPETGTWLWEQDLYGRRVRYLGAGHGLAGNAFAALRAAGHADAATLDLVQQRSKDTLAATAVHGHMNSSEGEVPLANWHPMVDRRAVAAWLAKGRGPLMQDCHGAPGIVCRLAGTDSSPAWDSLLRAAGEATWLAGPLAKGPSLCHGSAGSAMACLKLWHRFGEAHWLERARRLALHAALQVEQAREVHGQGRHSLWTGDLGAACVLWNCVDGDSRYPTLDCF